jgi:hypothetical protein
MIIATKLLEWVALDILEMTKNCMMMIRRKWCAMERKIELGKREAVLREREIDVECYRKEEQEKETMRNQGTENVEEEERVDRRPSGLLCNKV